MTPDQQKAKVTLEKWREWFRLQSKGKTKRIRRSMGVCFGDLTVSFSEKDRYGMVEFIRKPGINGYPPLHMHIVMTPHGVHINGTDGSQSKMKPVPIMAHLSLLTRKCYPGLPR